jgi:archaellum component FlaF (FlaF/FlaG flagellin family)
MNREIYPGGIYPLQGDVQSQAGNVNVAVVGLQNIPLQSVTLLGGELVEYNVNSNQWIPTLRATIQVNNVTVSDDANVSVNLPKPIKVNGA